MLCRKQCLIRGVEQSLIRGAVPLDCDSDCYPYRHLLPRLGSGRRTRSYSIADPDGELIDVFGSQSIEQDDELVAAVSVCAPHVADDRLNRVRHVLQDLVSELMPPRIVDRLE